MNKLPLRPYIVWGCGSWWALALTAGLGPATSDGTIINPSTSLLFFTIPSTASVALLLVFSRWLSNPTARRAVGYCSLVAACGSALLFAWGSPAAVTASQAIYGLASGAILMLWGTRFAFLDARNADYTTMLTACFSLTVFLVLVVVPTDALMYLKGGVLAFSSLCFVLDRDRSIAVRRSFVSERRSALINMYVSRVLIGLLIGYFTAELTEVSRVETSPVLKATIVVVVAGLAAFIYLARLETLKVSSLLPLAPLAAVGAILLPYVGAQDVLIVPVASSAVWFLWVILSSVQLSQFKEDFGMDEILLSASEKLAIMLSSLVAYALTAAFGRTGGAVASGLNEPVARILLFVFLMVVTASLLRFSQKHAFHELHARAATDQEDLERIWQTATSRIAVDYHLTQREAEVMALAAKGHTRPFIEEKLGIATGTARTHQYHIYTKLDIHRKEELLDLVSAYVANAQGFTAENALPAGSPHPSGRM